MNKREFVKLVSGVREMGAYLRGDEVKGARVTEIPDPDVREISRWQTYRNRSSPR